MLCAELMVRSDDGALEQTPYGLNAVRVHVPPNPLLHRVVHGFVDRVLVIYNRGVGSPVIRVERGGAIVNVVLDEGLEDFFATILCHAESDLAAPSERAEYNRFVGVRPWPKDRASIW